MHSDSLFISGQLVDAGDLSKKLLIDGTRITCVWISHKHTHLGCEDAVLRNEVYAVPRRVNRRKDLIELFWSWFRRAHANHTRDSTARLVAAFFTGRASHGGQG